MTVRERINDLRRRGVILDTRGDCVTFKAPPGALRDDDVTHIKEDREAFLVEIRRDRAGVHPRVAAEVIDDVLRAFDGERLTVTSIRRKPSHVCHMGRSGVRQA